MTNPKHDLNQIAKLSPFELKDVLIEAANSNQKDQQMLNAGRGNPNFLATQPRHAYHQLGLFALTESERSFKYIVGAGVGGMAQREGILDRFEIFSSQHKDVPGIKFLTSAVSFVRDQMGLDAEDFLYEMTEAILADGYPFPDRMLRNTEQVCAEYIRQEMIGNHPYTGKMDLFAVEGGSAAMAYIFISLKRNHLLKAGDKVALGLPIFQPYIEIPELQEFHLEEVHINAPSSNNWQFTKEELDKLRDPQVKAFFLVNPSNPPAVRISDENLAYIAEIVKERPDLMILTDDVYGTFCENFVSLYAYCPYNTMLVYSYSKYFGATGWRMGLIGLEQKNVYDDLIAKLPPEKLADLDKRYSSITTSPRDLKLIDRIVAESRVVALNHVAGLSTPAQVQMALFSLQELMDVNKGYKTAMKRIVYRRKQALYREIGLRWEDDPLSSDYYHLLDLEQIGGKLYGQEYVEWMRNNIGPNEIQYRLAEKCGVVLLPGTGFGTPTPSSRVSLANLNEPDYIKIGRAMHDVREEFHARFLADKQAGKC